MTVAITDVYIGFHLVFWWFYRTLKIVSIEAYISGSRDSGKSVDAPDDPKYPQVVRLMCHKVFSDMSRCLVWGVHDMACFMLLGRSAGGVRSVLLLSTDAYSILCVIRSAHCTLRTPVTQTS